jgi:hypothetical protein
MLANLLSNIAAFVFFFAFIAFVLSFIPGIRKRFVGIRRISFLALIGGLFLGGYSQSLKPNTTPVAETPNIATPAPQASEPAPVEPTFYSINFTSDPEGAEVIIGGESIGITPLVYRAEADKPFTYQIVAKEPSETERFFSVYKPFESTFTPTKDDALSVFVERTREDEQILETFERLNSSSIRAAVRTQCRNFVEKNLKAPRTAKFPGLFDDGDTFYANGADRTLRYLSWVDSENSFGAMLRTNFICVYDMNEDSITLEALE